MASNVTNVGVFSGWNSLDASMGPGGHVRQCQMSRFGDGRHDRCSLGPKRSLERVFFRLKSPFLRGVQRHVIGLQCHQSGCNFWLKWFIRINGTWGTCQTSRFGYGGPTRCSMGPKQSLERVFFSLKSSFQRVGSAVRYWPPMSPKWL